MTQIEVTRLHDGRAMITIPADYFDMLTVMLMTGRHHIQTTECFDSDERATAKHICMSIDNGLNA